MYSLYGDGEQLVGKWFKQTGKRNEIFLATKYGFVKPKPGETFKFEIDSSYEYTKEACAECLKNLDIEYIDLCE